VEVLSKKQLTEIFGAMDKIVETIITWAAK
jgi:hypothetical protein